jgi:hypothetical protein
VQRSRPPSTQTISVPCASAADPARWRSTRDVSGEVHPTSDSPSPVPGRPTESPTFDKTGNRLPAVPDTAGRIPADRAKRDGRPRAAAR